MNEQLKINILTSTDPTVDFDKTSTPLLVLAFEDSGHEVSICSAETPPELDELLNCDVFVDRSPITDTNFFNGLAHAYRSRRIAKIATPLMVDNPLATLTASDKRRTHALFPGLVPESYNLDGMANHAMIEKFRDDEFVVIKDPFGWYSKGTARLSPDEASEQYGRVRDMIVQKYIPYEKGVGRVLSAYFEGDFEVLCAYLMIPDSWRTGEGVKSNFELIECTPALKEFARKVTRSSGIYLNGADFIEHDGEYVLLENNTVPNLRVPLHYMGVDAPAMVVNHIERSVDRIR